MAAKAKRLMFYVVFIPLVVLLIAAQAVRWAAEHVLNFVYWFEGWALGYKEAGFVSLGEGIWMSKE